MKVRQGSEDRLRELNDQYQDALKRAMDGVPGFQSLRKYLVDDEYIEIVECDESFEEFGQAIAADPEVREFLRAVGECFEQSLRDMGQRRMECVQQIGDGG